MYKITYQVRTYCEMQQMGWNEWQQAMQTAKGLFQKQDFTAGSMQRRVS